MSTLFNQLSSKETYKLPVAKLLITPIQRAAAIAESTALPPSLNTFYDAR